MPTDELRQQIRQILLSDWDPTGASRNEASHGEYDAYIEPIHQMIQSGADDDAIVDYLRERESEIMCFPGLDRRRLMPVARKLLKLRSTVQSDR